MKTIVHVNQHVIRANKKHGRDDAPITVKNWKENIYCKRVKLKECEVVYSPHKPLSCGAQVWIETTEDVWLEGV